MTEINHQFVRSEVGVVNTDKEGLKAYKLKKEQFSKINRLEKRLDNIETLLKELLNKKV